MVNKKKDKKVKKEEGNGKLIVFDGIDGCGKSTVANLVASYLKSRGHKVVLTHEPSNTPAGKKIKELLRKKSSEKFSRRFWVTLFTQDRQEHIEKFIVPKLKDGYIVINDRYYYSTLAYQLNENEWEDYLKKYYFIKPYLAFILDVDPAIGIERMKKRKKHKTIFERLAFLEKTRRKFVKIYKKNLLNENIFLIDANQPLAKVISDVKKIIDKYI
ncbi:MAG: dTMP kinase [Candidatus Pacearchaeota archaeon]